MTIAAGASVHAHGGHPSGSLVAGVPARVRRALHDDERQRLLHNAEVYHDHRRSHEAAI